VVVDPGFDRHLRVSIRGLTATLRVSSGGRSGVRPPSEGVDPGFDRHVRVSIRVLTAT